MATFTTCPSGFVIPEHPNNANIIYANRSITDCAFSCVSHPRYTPEEYSTLFAIRLGSIIFTGVVGFICVNIIWFMGNVKLKTNFFVIVYCILMVVASLTMALVFVPGRAERFCEDSATPIYEQPTEVCTLEGFSMVTSLEIMIFCWCFQSMELFKSIVWGHRNGDPKRLLFWIVGLPIALSCILVVKGSFVYELGKINCDLWAKHPEEEFLFAWLPSILPVFVGFCCSVAIAVKITLLYRNKSRINDRNSNLQDVLKIFSAALKYLFGFGLYLGSFMLVAIASGNGTGSSSDVDLDLKWAACVFRYYDGVSDGSFLAQCGRTPERNVPFPTLCFFQIYQFGLHGFFFLAIYWEKMSNIVLRVWCPLRYYRKIGPVNIGELPVTASSAMTDDPFRGVEVAADASGAVVPVVLLSESGSSGASSSTLMPPSFPGSSMPPSHAPPPVVVKPIDGDIVAI